ncbi:dihydroorotase [Ekhidna sp.]|uniref:dihydroorotase n=1 Tax=Ekhidna sp. TaxID=2608089 RepID=UPI00329940F8
MSLLLKNVLVLDANSPSHNKKANILIEKGIITSLNAKSASKELDFSNLTITPGWFDLNSNFNDPGNEHKEDVESGSHAASAGGFTDVCLIPDTSPPIESKADVNYLRRKAIDAVDLHVIGSVSEGNGGENLTEILDLYHAGAIAFSSGDQPIWNSELLMKALQYTESIGIPIFQNSRDINISANSHMHEGLVSTGLGLRAEPSISEELSIQRDIEILRYTGGSIHFSKISSGKSVKMIREARKQGLHVTCDVGIFNLIFTDNSIGVFDTNFKNLPPYRTEQDRKALIKGVIDGTIDAICSNHRPQDSESKQLEFDLADPGSIALQTFYSSLLKIKDQVPFELLIEKAVNGPRKVLKIDPISIDKGQIAKLTILDPTKKWVFNSVSNQSKSRNSPFWEKELEGYVHGTINKGKLVIH